MLSPSFLFLVIRTTDNKFKFSISQFYNKKRKGNHVQNLNVTGQKLKRNIVNERNDDIFTFVGLNDNVLHVLIN